MTPTGSSSTLCRRQTIGTTPIQERAGTRITQSLKGTNNITFSSSSLNNSESLSSDSQSDSPTEGIFQNLPDFSQPVLIDPNVIINVSAITDANSAKYSRIHANRKVNLFKRNN
jgi:hypothetical protein